MIHGMGENWINTCDFQESHNHLPEILKKGWEALYYYCYPLYIYMYTYIYIYIIYIIYILYYITIVTICNIM